MGKRGPQKTPTKLKLLRGETRKSRLNNAAPKPGGAGPVMPPGMTDASKRVWTRQTKAMALTGVLTVVDSDVLRAYCDAVARYEQAEREYRKRGPLVAGARDGELVKNPLHQVVRDNAALIRLFARELGFTPGTREGFTPAGVEDPGGPPDTFGKWEQKA